VKYVDFKMHGTTIKKNRHVTLTGRKKTSLMRKFCRYLNHFEVHSSHKHTIFDIMQLSSPLSVLGYKVIRRSNFLHTTLPVS